MKGNHIDVHLPQHGLRITELNNKREEIRGHLGAKEGQGLGSLKFHRIVERTKVAT